MLGAILAMPLLCPVQHPQPHSLIPGLRWQSLSFLTSAPGGSVGSVSVPPGFLHGVSWITGLLSGLNHPRGLIIHFPSVSWLHLNAEKISETNMAVEMGGVMDLLLFR